MRLKYPKEKTIHLLIALFIAACSFSNQEKDEKEQTQRASRRTQRLDSLLTLSPSQKEAIQLAHLEYLRVMDELKPQKGEKLSKADQKSLIQSAKSLESTYQTILSQEQYTLYKQWKAEQRAKRKKLQLPKSKKPE